MMKKDNLKGISANVIILGVVSFLNDVSSEMIMPILPLFITTLGGGGLVIGLISGVMESVSSILKVLCGFWSDKSGKRKVFVFSGYLTSAFFKLLLSLSTIWSHIMIFSGLERVGKGLRTSPRDAIIADSMPEKRGKGFGIHRAFDTSGAILGSIIVFFLIWYSEMSYKAIILTAAIIAFLSLIPLRFVRETRGAKQDISLRLSLKSLPSSLKVYLLIAAVFTLANFSYMFFILRAKDSLEDLFGGKWTIGVPILLYILFNIFYALFAIPFGVLSDKIGRRWALIIGYLIFSGAALGFALLDSLWGFIVLFPLYGIANAAVDGNQRAFASDLSTKELRATAIGTFHTTIGLVALLSGLVAGLLWDVISPQWAFIYGSILSVFSAFLFLVFGRYFRRA
jgi:MFS family permease